jgi:hypothetical protein
MGCENFGYLAVNRFGARSLRDALRCRDVKSSPKTSPDRQLYISVLYLSGDCYSVRFLNFQREAKHSFSSALKNCANCSAW